MDTKRIVARYIVSPRQGRYPIPEACRQIEVEVEADAYTSTVTANAKLPGSSKIIGKISAAVSQYYLEVTHASMVSGGNSLVPGSWGDYSGCGIGTRLYEALAKYACEKDLTLASDTRRSEFSEAFWDKQHRWGRADYSRRDDQYFLYDACRDANNLSGLKIKTTKRRRRKG